MTGPFGGRASTERVNRRGPPSGLKRGRKALSGGPFVRSRLYADTVALGTYRMGALHVVENVLDVDWVNRLLRAVDPNLFCEKQMTYTSALVWCVVDDCGGEDGPVTVYEHRDTEGRPLPYPTQSMVDYFLKMRQEGLSPVERSQAAAQANRERTARFEQEMRDAYDDVGKQIRKRAKGRAVPPLLKSGAAGHQKREQRLRDGDTAREALTGDSY